jgi:hypothetical protein
VKKLQCDCRERTVDELTRCMHETEKLLNTILMKEWLLLNKMETVSEVKDMLYDCKRILPCGKT